MNKQIEEMTCKDNCVYGDMCYRRGVRWSTSPNECPKFKDNAGYRKLPENIGEFSDGLSHFQRTVSPLSIPLRTIGAKPYSSPVKKPSKPLRKGAKMENKELKPCPFCGDKPHLDRHDIFCDCGAKIEIPQYATGKISIAAGFPTYEEAVEEMIEAWNRRANDE